MELCHRLHSLPRTMSGREGGLPRRHVKIREPVEMQLGILPETFPLFPPEIRPGRVLCRIEILFFSDRQTRTKRDQ